MSRLQQNLSTHRTPTHPDVKPELKLRQELGCIFLSEEAFPQLSLVPHQQLPPARCSAHLPASISLGCQAAASTYLPGRRQVPAAGAVPGGAGSGQAWWQQGRGSRGTEEEPGAALGQGALPQE